MTAASSTAASPGDVILFIVVTAAAIAAYWVPAFVAWRRRMRNVGSVVVLNFFAFLVIPWIIALAMALADPPRPGTRQGENGDGPSRSHARAD